MRGFWQPTMVSCFIPLQITTTSTPRGNSRIITSINRVHDSVFLQHTIPLKQMATHKSACDVPSPLSQLPPNSKSFTYIRP